MMESLTDSREHEAHNARNLLLWGQEVFSWADLGTEEGRRKSPAEVCGVPVGAVLKLAPACVLKGCAEGQSPFAEGLGGVPQLLCHPPRLGAQGVEDDSFNANKGTWMTE